MGLRNSMLLLIPAIFACFLLVGPGVRRVAAQETEMSSQAGLPDAARMHEVVRTIRAALRPAGVPRDGEVRRLIAAEIRKTYDTTLAAISMISMLPADGTPSAGEHLLGAQQAHLREFIEQIARERSISPGERAALAALERKTADLYAEVREIAAIEDSESRAERIAVLRAGLITPRAGPSPTVWSIGPVSMPKRTEGVGKETSP